MSSCFDCLFYATILFGKVEVLFSQVIAINSKTKAILGIYLQLEIQMFSPFILMWPASMKIVLLNNIYFSVLFVLMCDMT